MPRSLDLSEKTPNSTKIKPSARVTQNHGMREGRGLVEAVIVPFSLRKGAAAIPSQTQQFTVADPRSFDGDPYEVAARAAAQAAAVARILAQTVESARVMARNAEMERELSRGDDPKPVKWDEGPHGRRFDEVQSAAEAAEKALQILGKAAGFDPKSPLGR